MEVRAMSTNRLVLVVGPEGGDGEYFETFLLIANNFSGGVPVGHEFYAKGVTLNIPRVGRKHGTLHRDGFEPRRTCFAGAVIADTIETQSPAEMVKTAFRELNWEVMTIEDGKKEFEWALGQFLEEEHD